MSYSFNELKQGYANLWDKAKATEPTESKALAEKIIANRSQLQPVEDSTDVPWWLVGCWLYRESDLNFNTYLGNGQSLSRVTTVVPAGRGPFQTFYAGAIDAIRYEDNARGGGFYKQGKSTWNLEYCLWASEMWNGTGYFHTGVNSPYIWDWTNLYTTGLYTSDGHFDPNVKENRAGVAAIMMALFEIDASLKPSRIASETPMTTTPTPTTTTPTAGVPQINLTQIIPIVEQVIGYLPIVATFVPQLAPVTPFVPIVKGILDMIQQLQSAPHTAQGIAGVIEQSLGNIVKDIQALKPNLPGTTTTTPATPTTGS